MHQNADQLEPCLHAIVEGTRPAKIMLFGSQAYGEPNEHSDVDLLVVRRGIESELHSNLEIRRAMREADFANLRFTILSKTLNASLRNSANAARSTGKSPGEE